MTERTHHIQRLLDRETIQFDGEGPLEIGNTGGTIVVTTAPQANGKLPNMFDRFKYGSAIGRANDIAEQAADILNFLSEAGVFFWL